MSYLERQAPFFATLKSCLFFEKVDGSGAENLPDHQLLNNQRRGKESNPPRRVGRVDNGFEDRLLPLILNGLTWLYLFCIGF
jgi:hypothetical protein